MKGLSFLLLLLLTAVLPAAAQIRPEPGTGDPRLQTVDYDPGQIVQLQAAPGYQLTVQLASDEQVENVAVGDSGAWQVSVNGARDHLFIKPLQAEVPTNMTVITSVRVYNFELFPQFSPSSDTPWNVRFRYPDAQAEAASSEFVDVSKSVRRSSRYRIGGDRLLRPMSVTHDGSHTYIRWPASAAIPAVYEISSSGEEMLANGGMRGDDYVIDGVAQRLVFRIDRRAAHARWLAPKVKR